VWEWTTSPATPYAGNTKITLPTGQTIIRGGAYVEKATGEDAVTATRRSWVLPKSRDLAIGFRLVRAE
jgi:formylglycine-generating enzyme required for sulfatase activity